LNRTPIGSLFIFQNERDQYYNWENDNYRTSRINSVFSPIPELGKVFKDYKEKGLTISDQSSSFVTAAGLEPATVRAEI
jgi:hypothetical protein